LSGLSAIDAAAIRPAMTTILLTGFGPFPGAPRNPTAALVRTLAQRRIMRSPKVRRRVHVFATSYAAVDRELPALLARLRPDVILMFGLAARRRHISIETRARNALTRALPDASGHLPAAGMIAAGTRATLSLRVPADRLVGAVRAAGMAAARSGDAGTYLCNYLCWRAGEAAERTGGPRLVAFVHVPNVHAESLQRPAAHRRNRPRARPPITFEDLVRAGEAIMKAALATPSARR
jgi:pyroglutamyl-peptidase